MEDNWALVYSTNKEHLADLAKQTLEENGIEAVIINKRDSSYLIGTIELYVPINHLGEATQLIKNLAI